MKKTGSLIYWILLAALGVFFILGHSIAFDIFGKIVAAGLILTALIGFWGWWKNRSFKPEGISKLIGNAVFLIIGIWILADTPAFETLFNRVIGIVIAIAGLLTLISGIKSKNALFIILGSLAVILGCVVACFNAATTALYVCEGIGLIYTAVTGFIADRRRKKKAE